MLTTADMSMLLRYSWYFKLNPTSEFGLEQKFEPNSHETKQLLKLLSCRFPEIKTSVHDDTQLILTV